MREIRTSGSEGGVRFYSSFLPLFSTISERNPNKKKWFQVDWSIWLKRKNRKKALRAEAVCLAGTILLIGIGVGVYFVISHGGANQSMVSTPEATLLP